MHFGQTPSQIFNNGIPFPKKNRGKFDEFLDKDGNIENTDDDEGNLFNYFCFFDNKN